MSEVKKQLPYTKLIEVNKSLIKRLQDQVSVIRANRKVISAIAKELGKLGKCDVSPSGSGSRVQFSVVATFDGFKGRKLINVLEKVSALAGAEFTSRDYPDYSNRDFSLQSELFGVFIGAYLKSDAKSCQKVLVRIDREITEKPVYELRCN